MRFYQYIFKRVLLAIPLLVMVSILSFVIIRCSPIDPLAELRFNPAITPETLKLEEQRLGLDKPLYVQYIRWFNNAIKGDFGLSVTGEKVSDRIMERLPKTFILSFLTLLVSWLVAVPLGILAALYWKSYFDRVLTILSSVGMAIPSFFLALLMLVFAVQTGWFPVGGFNSIGIEKASWWVQMIDIAHHLVLPVFILSVLSLAGLQRQMRGNLLDVLESDYVKMARAKGLPNYLVIYKHAVRNAINPLITMLGYELAGLLSGAALTEYVLQYPGLGQLMLEAAIKGDMNLVMASLMMGAILLVLGNLIADILLKLVDPRITLS